MDIFTSYSQLTRHDSWGSELTVEPVPVTDCYDWTPPQDPRIRWLSLSVCPLSSASGPGGGDLPVLTYGDAEAALELVLAVVEEGAKDQ